MKPTYLLDKKLFPGLGLTVNKISENQPSMNDKEKGLKWQPQTMMLNFIMLSCAF